MLSCQPRWFPNPVSCLISKMVWQKGKMAAGGVEAQALSVMVSLAPILGFTDSPRLFYMQRDAFLVAQASNIMGLRENNFPISLPETEILVCLQCRQFWGASLLFWCLFGLFFLVLWASHCNTH